MTGFLNAGGGTPAGGPWSGLPTGQAPWSGGSQWLAAQQAPWRLSPWQTQGMPQGAPVAPPPAASQLGSLTPQGSSGGLEGFDPLAATGGFYPAFIPGSGVPLGGQAAPPLTGGISGWTSGGQVFDSRAAANAATSQHNQMIADSPMPNDWRRTKHAGLMGGLVPTNVGRGTANPVPSADQILGARRQAYLSGRGQPRF